MNLKSGQIYIYDNNASQYQIYCVLLKRRVYYRKEASWEVIAWTHWLKKKQETPNISMEMIPETNLLAYWNVVIDV